MCNFRPFLGRNEIELSTTKEKPVILIKAMNDVGKTTIFNAFIWCLYGGSSEENSRNINWSAHRKSDGRTSVNLIFNHNGKQYEIQRSVDFKKLKKGTFLNPLKDKLTITIDGKPELFENIGKANNYIKSILPKDASQFFFFDGEKIQEYTEARSGDSVKNAIQIVLGIKEMLNAREDLTNIFRDLRRELDHLLAKNVQAKEEAEQNEKLLEEITSLRNELPILDERIENCRKTIGSCDESLNKHSNIQQKVEERKEEEEKEKELEAKIEHNEKSQLNVRQDIAFLLAAPLLEQLEKIGEKQLANWKKTAISYILLSRSNRCICERPLDGVVCPKCHTKFGSNIENIFEEQLDKGESGSRLQFLGTLATPLLRKKNPKLLEKNIYDFAENRVKLESELSVCKSNIEQLKEEIGGQGDFSIEIAQAEKLRSRATDQIKEYQEKKKQKEIEIVIKDRQYKKKQDELVNRTGYDEDVRKKTAHLRVCTLCIEGFDYAIEELVENSAAKVAELASKNFLQLTNAPRLYEALEITDDYEIRIRTRGGTVRHVWDQAPGAGQRQIIAISFIAALNAFTARDAPIVIDTPISRLDPLHKRNLVCYYPQMGSQTIILYQPNELGDEEIELIQDSIHSEWELKRDPADPEITIISSMRSF